MKSLVEWLDYQQDLHSRAIDLSLERVRSVAGSMGLLHPSALVITVAGTNGKGSTVAFLDAVLRAAGKHVGCYTSPHLLNYNERIRIDGVDVDDALLVAAFAHIDSQRENIPLTYFEFGTLAALWIFSKSELDVLVLEVGLGGRLDAVNIIDADVAVVTTVDLDHQEYLGPDRDSIGCEKAGIFRSGRPAVVAEAALASGLLEEAKSIDAHLVCAGQDYFFLEGSSDWEWRHADGLSLHLPKPRLESPCQIANAAVAIAALHALRSRLGWVPEAIATGIANAYLPARLQHFSGAVELVVDVAHNPQASRMLASWLSGHPSSGSTYAVFSALGDKDIDNIVAPLQGLITHWHLAGLHGETTRGLTTEQLSQRVKRDRSELKLSEHEDIATALSAVSQRTQPGDRVLAFGSFLVAAAALQWASEHQLHHV